MKRIPVYLLALTFIVAATLSGVSASVSLSGNVTLTNPDNSTYTFTDSNATTYNQVSNYPDGWWFFGGAFVEDTSDYWVIGVLFGIVAIGLVFALVYQRGRKDE